MHLASTLALIVGGAVGLWYGFVDDVELAFLAGLVAWATATVAAFRGNFNPPDDLARNARLDVRTTTYSAVTVALLALGAAGAWVGFVEDIKVGVLVTLLAWAAATYLAFGGSAKRGSPGDATGFAANTSESIGFVTLIVGGLVAGAVGIWYGLVEDMEIGFAAGVLVWAGTTLATFRGKITLN
jgi:hypothetical protein